ncbi:class I SAM-dependent methyltransferase [Psychrosphaera sp. I2R16]|uniref:class I SAM-dependent methyltransferase n=1 Tax=unclassified Psychrosphaera TaxID=2641570 RepID=UPI0034CF5344
MTLDYYNQHAEAFFDATVNVDMNNIYQKFLPFLKPNAQIVDAGCGSGRDALYFKSQGFKVTAFDASIELAHKAQRLLGQQVAITTFERFSIQEKVDGIWCCASLLHLSKSELLPSLKNLNSHLNNGGVMYISFKYGDAERIEHGRQFIDMNESTLTALINNLPELTISETWITGDNRPGRENEKWLNAILLKDNN